MLADGPNRVAEAVNAHAIDAEAVLAYWLGEAEREDADLDARGRLWFGKDEAVDAHIAARFGAAVEDALAGRLDAWAGQPRGWLALLILLDQFPRNLFRGSARAFAGDSRARELALAGIDRGDDRRLAPAARLFAYLPLEHAEDATLQARAVALFERLCATAPAAQRVAFEGFLDYARRHRAVIDRFGRFPHRNAVLGRASTADEAAYLAEPGAGF